MKTIVLQLAFLAVAGPALAMTGEEFGHAGIADQASIVDGASQALTSTDPAFRACLAKMPEHWEQRAIQAIHALDEFDVTLTTEIYVRSECRRQGPR